MEWVESPLSEHAESIRGTFETEDGEALDLSIIASVVYFDGWSDYEESGGILVFVGIDGSIQIVDYGYSVMTMDNRNLFYPRQVTREEAEKEINAIEASESVLD